MNAYFKIKLENLSIWKQVYSWDNEDQKNYLFN